MTTRAVSWRYVLLAAGFAALATVRFGDGAPVWGLVFTAAAGVNAWLAVHEGRRAPRPVPEAPLPDREALLRSREAHLGSARRWRLLACAASATGAGLLLLEPVLALPAAVITLFCVFRARRAGRYTATLQRALDSLTGRHRAPASPGPPDRATPTAG